MTKQLDSAPTRHLLVLLSSITIIITAIVDFLIVFRLLPFPLWLSDILIGSQEAVYTGFYNLHLTEGVVYSFLGLIGFYSWMGYLKDLEISRTLSILSLTVIVGSNVAYIINWIVYPQIFDITYFPNWLRIINMVMGFLGFFYIFTVAQRYN